MSTVNTLGTKIRKMMRKCILHVRNSARKVKNEHFSDHFLQNEGYGLI